MKLLNVVFTSLICTITIELLGALLIGIRHKRDLLNVTLVNILTNPIVVSVSLYFNILYGIWPKRIAMIFLEIGAFLIEGFIYKKTLFYKKKSGYQISLILNALSYTLGLIINFIIYK